MARCLYHSDAPGNKERKASRLATHSNIIRSTCLGSHGFLDGRRSPQPWTSGINNKDTGIPRDITGVIIILHVRKMIITAQAIRDHTWDPLDLTGFLEVLTITITSATTPEVVAKRRDTDGRPGSAALGTIETAGITDPMDTPINTQDTMGTTHGVPGIMDTVDANKLNFIKRL